MAIEVYPVVHINDMRVAIEMTGVARDLGACGVYLIDHRSYTPANLLRTFSLARKEYSGFFLGINALCMDSSYRVFSMLHERSQLDLEPGELPDGIWVDDAYETREEALSLRQANPLLATIRYLGGVSFKYTPRFSDNPVDSAAQACEMKEYVDVVTTSGTGTGRPPSPDKIAAMKEAVGEAPLAVASGVSVDNIASYSGNIDQLLVASSIETSQYSGVFDEKKLSDLIQAALEN